MKELLRALDIFSYKITLNYKNKNVYNSFFGMILSFLLYGITFYLLFYFSEDFIYQTNPIVMYKESQFNYNHTFKLKQLFRDFRFSYQYQTNQSNSEHDFSKILFEIKLFLNTKGQIIYKNNPQYILLKFDKNETVCDFDETKTCSKNILSKEVTYLYENGSSIDFNYSEVDFTVGPGDKLDMNLNFGDSLYDVIQKNGEYIFQFDISYDLDESVMDATNKEFFMIFTNTYNTKIYSFLNSQDYSYNDFYYGLVNKTDDKGIIFSEKYIDSNFRKVTERENKIKYDRYNPIVPLSAISFDKVMKIYERKYKKVQNIFADLGGIFSTLVVIGNIIIYSFNKRKFNYDLINHLFRVDIKNEEEILNKKAKLIKKYRNDINIDNINNLENCNSQEKKYWKSDDKINLKSYDNIQYRDKIKTTALRKEEINEFIYHSDNQIIFNKNEKIEELSLKIQKRKSSTDKKEVFFNKKIIYENNKIEDLKENKTYIDKKLIRDIFTPESMSNLINDFEYERKLKNKFDQYKNEARKKINSKKIIKFTNCEFIKTFLCCKKIKGMKLIHKEKKFMKLEEKIDHFMDVINYADLFENIEKLKMIILNRNQTFSFNFLKTREYEDITQENFDEKLFDLVRYLKRQKNSKNMNKMDKKIFENLNYGFYKLFKELE